MKSEREGVNLHGSRLRAIIGLVVHSPLTNLRVATNVLWPSVRPLLSKRVKTESRNGMCVPPTPAPFDPLFEPAAEVSAVTTRSSAVSDFFRLSPSTATVAALPVAPPPGALPPAPATPAGTLFLPYLSESSGFASEPGGYGPPFLDVGVSSWHTSLSEHS